MKIVVPDSWGRLDPRRWQSEAMPVIAAHYAQPNPSRGVVYAVTGSGKSVLIAQIVAACSEMGPKDVVVVSTPSIKLVRQLKGTIDARIGDDEFTLSPKVGQFYTFAHDTHTPIIVCCNDSMKELATALQCLGRDAVLWICDEVHRSQSATVKEAYDILMPRMSIGFSATPYRANEKEGLSLFDDVIVRYDVKSALADKNVVVPWAIRNWEGGETTLDEACLIMMRACTGPGIVNAVSIADAENFAKFLTVNEYPAMAVHSGLTDSEVDERIGALLAGVVRAVVHVNLLTEGIDITAIEHITLRRRVSSRNRFVQEAGRGLRFHRDEKTGREKTELIVNDPHDLMSVFRLTYEAVLSGDFDPDEVEEKDEGKALERILTTEVFDFMRFMTKVKTGDEPVSVLPMASYLTQLLSIYDAHGMVDRKIAAREWRKQGVSERQLKAIEGLRWSIGKKCVPSIHQKALNIVADYRGMLSKGAASDLLSIQMALADKRGWPTFKNLDQIAQSGIDKHEKRLVEPTPALKPNAAPQKPKLEQGLLFETKKPQVGIK